MPYIDPTDLPFLRENSLQSKNIYIKQAEEYLKNHHVTCCREDRQFYLYEEGYYKKIHDLEVKNQIMAMFPSHANSNREQVMENVRAIANFSIKDTEFDNLINFKNGIFNTDDYSFIQHTPKIFSTTRLDYDYDPKADWTKWGLFLSSSQPQNTANIRNLQEFAGYCLTKNTLFDKCLILIGDGANGKSVFVDTLCAVVGENNYSSVAMGDLAQPNKRSTIAGKLINVDTDVCKRVESFEAPIRAICSGAPITLSPKYVPEFKIRPYCKLIMCINEFPHIDDLSHAFFRRLIIVRFPVSFRNDPDIMLRQKLKNELSGIFNWMIDGLKRLRKNCGFSVNDEMRKEVISLREQSNPILIFSSEELVHDPQSYIDKRELYNMYASWCRDNGNKPFAKKRFGTIFYDLHRERTEMDTKRNNMCVWPGFRKKTDMDTTFEETVQEQKYIPWEE